jgi:hypothetical protein
MSRGAFFVSQLLYPDWKSLRCAPTALLWDASFIGNATMNKWRALNSCLKLAFNIDDQPGDQLSTTDEDSRPKTRYGMPMLAQSRSFGTVEAQRKDVHIKNSYW